MDVVMRYEARRMQITDSDLALWTIPEGRDFMFFLCRVCYTCDGEEFSCDRVAIFHIDAEGERFNSYSQSEAQ